MSVSQFTIYSSHDASAPVLDGTAGSLLEVLDACLVDGYGAKAAAGWSKPSANSGNCGHYLQGAGSSGYHLFINDDGPHVTSTYMEAWATGWKTMSGIAAPVGAGTCQFPLPAQQLTTGHVSIRKSNAADSSVRSWMVVADSRTVYLFVAAIIASPLFLPFYFGDIYSLAGASDGNRCLIAGRQVENAVTTGLTSDAVGGMTFSGGSAGTCISGTNSRGLWIAGSANGVSTSIGARFTSFWHPFSYGASETYNPWGGPYIAPNAADNSIRLGPIRVHTAGYLDYRGRLRGMWAPAHPASTFAEGQIITGANETAGKTFRAVRLYDGGVLFIETSNTVETN